MERPQLLLQDNPCVPLELTVAPQGHGCSSQMFRPRRRPTAIRMASSDRRRPQAVIDSYPAIATSLNGVNVSMTGIKNGEYACNWLYSSMDFALHMPQIIPSNLIWVICIKACFVYTIWLYIRLKSSKNGCLINQYVKKANAT